MRKAIIAALLFITLFAIGCTENQKAKMYGGTMTVNLPVNKKLVMATWKDNNLWYLLRDAKPGEKPKH